MPREENESKNNTPTFSFFFGVYRVYTHSCTYPLPGTTNQASAWGSAPPHGKHVQPRHIRQDGGGRHGLSRWAEAVRRLKYMLGGNSALKCSAPSCRKEALFLFECWIRPRTNMISFEIYMYAFDFFQPRRIRQDGGIRHGISKVEGRRFV